MSQDPSAPASQSSAAYRDLLAALGELEASVFDRTDLPDTARLEAYPWMLSLLRVGVMGFMWSDPMRPQFFEIVGPNLKWGGDNADAYYKFVRLDPTETYRVTGTRGDAVYLSLTVYGGPDDGHYSDRIVGTMNDRMFDVAEDGTFEFFISPEAQDGPTLALTPDAGFALTRDYLNDPLGGKRASWVIENVNPSAKVMPTDESTAKGIRAATTWVREQGAFIAVSFGDPNTVLDPYPVPTQTVGWAAGDAAYAMGSYELRDEEVLILSGSSPPCAFWNMCLWTPFLHTYDYAYDRVTINGAQVEYAADGSWEIAIAGTDPGHPNWVSTQGHPSGLIWFRWFLPEQTPAAVKAEVRRR